MILIRFINNPKALIVLVYYTILVRAFLQKSGGHMGRTIEGTGERKSRRGEFVCGIISAYGELNVTASSRTGQKLDRECNPVAGS